MPPSAWIALCLGTAGVFADMYTTQSILPTIGRSFGLSPATTGLTISAVVLAVAAGSLVAGPLSDRIGRKPVMVGASALLVVPTVLCGLAPTFGLLVACRALQGLLMPGLTSVAIVYVGGQVLGGLLARGASAALAGLLDWRLALSAFALPTAGGALALAFWLPPVERAGRGHMGVRWADVGTHLRNVRLLATCVVGFSLFFGFIGTFTYIPYYLTGHPFDVPPVSLGLIYLVWATGILSPVAGTWSMRIGRQRAIAASLSVACAGMLVTLIPALAVIVLGLGLLAIGMFTAIPSVNLLIGEVTSVAKGTASALYLCCYYLGGSVGAVLPGLAWERFGWHGVIALCLTMALVALGADVVLARAGRGALDRQQDTRRSAAAAD
jgi:MFS transporter, YNFM family, putative membrane transport protein